MEVINNPTFLAGVILLTLGMGESTVTLIVGIVLVILGLVLGR